MKVLKGISVAPGIAIGKAKIIKQKRLEIKKRDIEKQQVQEEINKLERVLEEVIKDTDNLIDEYSVNKANQEIFDSHKMILQDPEMKEEVVKLMHENLIGLEQAIHQHFSKVAAYFESLDNDFFAQKAIDYTDVSHRILNILIGRKGFKQNRFNREDIPIFYTTTPSQIIHLAREGVKGFYLEKGSETSHNAIIARSFDLTCIVGIPDLFTQIENNDLIILDGDQGKIIINPEPEILKQYREKLTKLNKHKEDLLSLIEVTPNKILDKRINLQINIEVPEEIVHTATLAPDGIGLFRTEFLFMDKDTLPTEEEQFKIYKDMAEKMGNKPVIIRTFDLGGDKFSNIVTYAKEENPFLGNRGLRFSLSHPNIFRTQINAILRASIYGKIKIMFPMVMGVSDYRKAKTFVKKVMSNLINKGYEVDENIEIGVMIEIPSAAICSEQLAQEVDFFSIGTNDLIQYTLSVDRTNEMLSDYYIPHHPAVLNLIKITADSANKYNIPISVCGAMASVPKYIPLLIALGISTFSIAPSAYLDVKKRVLDLQDKDVIELQNFNLFTDSDSIEKIIRKVTP
ncbi:phosphoenolpyruvate--protein phosphotransferase [bacterium]|nr:phosphoenolpyruvate--protein phosphotransferase [bacterium]